MLKNYRMGFDVWGLMLFLAVMIPNIIWFAIPAPNDVLRTQSLTPVIDMIASVCQVLMVFSLCAFINTKRKKLALTPVIGASAACVILYYVCWVLYYTGITAVSVILGMTVLPCLAFLLFAIDRKNAIALVPAAIFSVCHIIFALVNFII